MFFTAALDRRGGTRLTDDIARLRMAFARTRAERPFTLDACVVLPDHLHCLLTLPPGDTDFPARWQRITARFAGALPRGDARSDPRADTGLSLRQHPIRDEAEYHTLLRLCWDDPVRHGLCASPHDWPHSSIHRDLARGLVA